MAKKRIELVDSGVVFDEDKHTYNLNGNYLSGITGVIQKQLFPNEFDNIPAEVLKAAAEYGTEVHHSCEDFDREWINDGTQEVQDYIQLCNEHGLVHEFSEYTVTDREHWASNIDKVYRIDECTFDLADLKTYGTMTTDKLEKARWQLSIYAYLFELQNPNAKVRELFILHIRNKLKTNGEYDNIRDFIPVSRIPKDICKELLDTELIGKQFHNPYSIPEEIIRKESHIRRLIALKQRVDDELSDIKSSILSQMEAKDIRSWFTDTMRITRKLPTTRTAFNLQLFKSDHPELDYAKYTTTSQVASSITITV